MAYRLKKREGMATGVRRIVHDELGRAIDELEGRRSDDTAAAVHEARKHLKKTRAALRLVRDDLGANLRRDENAALRDAQGRLSGARDAEVMLETLAGLPDGRVPAAAAEALRDALRERRDAARRQGHDERAEAIADLQTVRGRVASWPLDDESFATAAQGLRRIYRDGRRAQRVATVTDESDAWHEWRKRVKDLWYAARILRPAAPLELGAVVDEADQLAKLLGDHNDLAVLRAAVAEHADATTDHQAAQLRAAIDEAAISLRRQAAPLGLRLYAEKPKRFVARVEAYMQTRAAQRAAEAQWIARPPRRACTSCSKPDPVPARATAHASRASCEASVSTCQRPPSTSTPRPPTSTHTTSTRSSRAEPYASTEAAQATATSTLPTAPRSTASCAAAVSSRPKR